MSPKAQQRIIYVRRTEKVLRFTYVPPESPAVGSGPLRSPELRTGLADATIAVGTVYEGGDLKFSHPFVEMSIK
jgi:hypothetical protein